MSYRPLSALGTTLLALGLVACTETTPQETVTETTTAEELTLEQNPPQTTSPLDTAAGECEASALARDIDSNLDVVTHCDGQWLRGGRYQTEWVIYAYWEDDRWNEYASHGQSFTGFPCHHLDRARTDGVPEEIVTEMLECS